MKLRVFTSFYNETSTTRRAELVECLNRNLNEPAVSNVCVLLEGVDAPLVHPKLLTRRIDVRPLYRDFFQWANELADDLQDLSVICNSDIYFDSTLLALGSVLSTDQCVALCRWNVDEAGQASLYHRNDSQDTWVFRGHIRELVDDYPIGVPRCDNRLLYELRAVGYQVINPALSVRSFHLHAGEREPYSTQNLKTFVDAPYNYLFPHNLCSLPQTLLHNVRRPEAAIGWRIDWQYLKSTLPVRAFRKVASTFAKGSQAPAC